MNDMVFINRRSAVRSDLTALFPWGKRENGRKSRFFEESAVFIYDPNILWPFSYWIYFPNFDPFYDVN